MRLNDMIRLTTDGEKSDKGLIFVDPKTAQITDLRGVRLLQCGVDTVRQLYRGVIFTHIFELFEKPGALVDFAGERWHSGRVGKDSGYQYKLQNADTGFILLLKNFNAKVDAIGPHLKIEVSPHAIDALSPARLQERLDHYAALILEAPERNQCAVHLALDLQGWKPSEDIVARMHCRARTQRSVNGMSEIEWATKSSVYNRGETAMFGSPGSVQLAIYNKTLQARAVDKLDYWEGVWRRRDSFEESDPGNYNPEQDVWRVELRFHHSVVEQFSLGSCDIHTGAFVETDSFQGFAPHLDGLWRYGLGQFKLLSRPGYFDPIWTVFRSDVSVDLPVDSMLGRTEYRRHYKTARGFSGKNVELFLGNFVSLLARERVGARRAFHRLLDWECWPVIRDHYLAKGMDQDAVYKHIKAMLEERHVRWGRAV